MSVFDVIGTNNKVEEYYTAEELLRFLEDDIVIHGVTHSQIKPLIEKLKELIVGTPLKIKVSKNLDFQNNDHEKVLKLIKSI